LLLDADIVMGRNRKRHAPQKGKLSQKCDKSVQLSLDPWLKSTEEAGNTLDHDRLALLLSAVDDTHGVIISGQEAASGQDSTSGILSEASPAHADIGSDVYLDTEVVSTDRTISTIIRAISGDHVKRAQSIISEAIGKCEDVQKTAICNAIELLYPYRPQDGQRDALKVIAVFETRGLYERVFSAQQPVYRYLVSASY
jgi:hypothetical protein